MEATLIMSLLTTLSGQETRWAQCLFFSWGTKNSILQISV